MTLPPHQHGGDPSASSAAGVRRVLLSWSSGKDSAWALHVLRQTPDVEIVGLLTTLNEAAQRVAMHGVRRDLLQMQAHALALPLREVMLPWPCDNAEYERRMAAATHAARDAGVTHIAFGDLFLEDVRRYRERNLAGTGITPLFPLWGRDTRRLAREMVDAGLRATLTCIDPRCLDASFVGRPFHELIGTLPADVDPCGERGEFHSFVHAAPGFAYPLEVRVTGRVQRDGYWFAELEPGRATVPAEER